MPSDGNKIHRRKVLKALGASGAAVTLAGCSDDTDDTNPTATGNPGNTGNTGTNNTSQAQNCQPVDNSFTGALPDSDPTKYQFNPFNGKLLFGDGFHYDYLGTYARASQEYKNRLVENWSIDKDAFTLTLRDQMWMKRSGDIRSGEWSELEPVTAEDISLQLWMWQFQKSPVADLFSDWTVKDDKVIEIRRSDKGFSDRIFKQRAIPNRVFTPRALWKDTIEELKGMEQGSEEFSATLGEKVLNRKIGPGELVANGPWLFDTVKAKRQVVAKKNPSHPSADQINFGKRDWVKVGKGKQGMVTAMTQNSIDYAGDQKLTQSVKETLQDNWQLTKTPALGGGSMFFNTEHEWFGKPNVRRAFRFAVSNKEIANNVNANPVSGVATGITNPTVRQNWLGSDFMGKMTDYTGKQRDKAAQLMREAGAEKNSDGWWADSAGNPIEAPIKTLGGWTAAVTQTQTMASQLQDFGIKANTVGIANSDFFNNHWVPSEPSQIRDFSIIKYPLFGAFGIWHPYYYEFLYYSGQIAQNQIKSTGEYEVPSEIGNPDSSTETVNATALTEEMATTDDEARITEITKKLAWTFNQNITVFNNTAGTNHTYYDTSDWNIPDVSDPGNPPNAFIDSGLNGLISDGTVTAKCQNK